MIQFIGKAQKTFPTCLPSSSDHSTIHDGGPQFPFPYPFPPPTLSPSPIATQCCFESNRLNSTFVGTLDLTALSLSLCTTMAITTVLPSQPLLWPNELSALLPKAGQCSQPDSMKLKKGTVGFRSRERGRRIATRLSMSEHSLEAGPDSLDRDLYHSEGSTSEEESCTCGECTIDYGTIVLAPDRLGVRKSHSTSPESATRRAKFTSISRDSDTAPLEATDPFAFSKSIVLQNTSSVARDHLALERTFLSYLRTSLGVTVAGIALIQMFDEEKTMDENMIAADDFSPSPSYILVKNLGVAATLTGIWVLCAAVRRYFIVQSALMDGQFPVARGTMFTVAFAIGCVVVAIFAVVIAVA